MYSQGGGRASSYAEHIDLPCTPYLSGENAGSVFGLWNKTMVCKRGTILRSPPTLSGEYKVDRIKNLSNVQSASSFGKFIAEVGGVPLFLAKFAN